MTRYARRRLSKTYKATKEQERRHRLARAKISNAVPAETGWLEGWE